MPALPPKGWMMQQNCMLLMNEILYLLIGGLSHHLRGFIEVVCGISSINSICAAKFLNNYPQSIKPVILQI